MQTVPVQNSTAKILDTDNSFLNFAQLHVVPVSHQNDQNVKICQTIVALSSNIVTKKARILWWGYSAQKLADFVEKELWTKIRMKITGHQKLQRQLLQQPPPLQQQQLLVHLRLQQNKGNIGIVSFTVFKLL